MKTIIVDIDGTVANKGNRNPYDWMKVGEDEPYNDIVELVHVLSNSYKIIFLSGRDSVCREITIEWLDLYFSKYELYMRAEGDMRADDIVKRELYENNIKGKDVLFVLDDRNKVVKMWRELGLRCLQVQEGNF